MFKHACKRPQSQTQYIHHVYSHEWLNKTVHPKASQDTKNKTKESIYRGMVPHANNNYTSGNHHYPRMPPHSESNSIGHFTPLCASSLILFQGPITRRQIKYDILNLHRQFLLCKYTYSYIFLNKYNKLQRISCANKVQHPSVCQRTNLQLIAQHQLRTFHSCLLFVLGIRSKNWQKTWKSLKLVKTIAAADNYLQTH